MKLSSKIISAFEAVYLHTGVPDEYWDLFPLRHELQAIWEVKAGRVFYSLLNGGEDHRVAIIPHVIQVLQEQGGVFRGKEFTLIAIYEDGNASYSLFDNSKENKNQL